MAVGVYGRHAWFVDLPFFLLFSFPFITSLQANTGWRARRTFSPTRHRFFSHQPPVLVIIGRSPEFCDTFLTLASSLQFDLDMVDTNRDGNEFDFYLLFIK